MSLKAHILNWSWLLSQARYNVNYPLQEGALLTTFVNEFQKEVETWETKSSLDFSKIESSVFVQTNEHKDFYFKMQKAIFSLEDLDQDKSETALELCYLLNNYVINHLNPNIDAYTIGENSR